MRPLRIDHNAQLARRERPECVSVVRSGAPSLSTLSTGVQLPSAFSSSRPPLFSTQPFLSLGHILACSSVCLPGFVQTLALPRFLPNANIQTQMEMWETEKRKKKKEKKGPRRHTHLNDTREKYCTDDVFIQFLIRKPQKCPASFARLRASPMSDTSLVGAPTTLQVLKQNNHCAIPNKRPQKQ